MVTPGLSTKKASFFSLRTSEVAKNSGLLNRALERALMAYFMIAEML
jgi:hypothetical protein